MNSSRKTSLLPGCLRQSRLDKERAYALFTAEPRQELEVIKEDYRR